MRLLILSQYFPPEIGAPQTRLWAMAKELILLGHEVDVVTAMPNYPKGRIFPEFRGKLCQFEQAERLRIQRLWVYAALGGGWQRILNYVSFMCSAVIGLARCRKPDYIFVESPPLLLSLPAYLFSRLWRVPFVLNVADLWPDSVIEKGFLREGLAMRILTALERWSYRKSAYVNAMTEAMRSTLLGDKHVPADKVLFFPNGVDTTMYRPQPADFVLKERLGLSGKKIILYAGTQGHAHALEYVLCAAKLLESHPDIHFLFLGSGSVRQKLEELHQRLDLRNVTFMDPIPLEQLPAYLSIAECGLSSLRNLPLFNGARPAKVFPILASGKPLIFVGRGEGANLIAAANAGIVVTPADPEALKAAVVRLVENPQLGAELGRNGRRYVEDNLQWSKLVRDWMSRIDHLRTTNRIGRPTEAS
jgi:colanic acid biosynthesis glycosyl transferase WcaI